MIPLKQIKMYKRFDFNAICHQRQLVSVSTRLQSGADKNNNDNDKKTKTNMQCFGSRTI